MFEIPIVLFIFKRDTGLAKIFERIRAVKPKKIYLIADGPRNEEEKQQIERCRELAESSIDWNCEIVRNYAAENRGVYANIGEGSQWVLRKEKMAIFLEDDNLPDISFFYYCEELLHKYEKNMKVLWICGTNYLEDYNSEYSYMFTQHLLPCGWASWSDKFLKYYDGMLSNLENEECRESFKSSYTDLRLYKQQLKSIERTKLLISKNKKQSSWDYQMLYSIRAYNLYGISPKVNLIENIGVDNFSVHGGNSKKKTMVNRFCGMKSKKLSFPLIHPTTFSVDKEYETKIGRIILYPTHIRLIQFFTKYAKKSLGLKECESLQDYIKSR